MNPPRVYDLSFVSKQVSQSGKPEIEIAIPDRYFGAFKVLLEQALPHFAKGVRKYVGHHPGFALFMEGRYGYRSCASYTLVGDTLRIRLELSQVRSRDVTATLHVTLDTLMPLFREHEGDGTYDEKQYFEIRTMCHYDMHGHAVSGWVFPIFRKWLVKKGMELEVPKPFSSELYLGKPFAPSVREAMQEAWIAINKREFRKYTKECHAGLREDGRFLLHCFGNACDLGIYPDQCSGRESEDTMVEFDSHNLDTYAQQLTLVSGLAALAALARTENESNQ